jgi:hypothetical protein
MTYRGYNFYVATTVLLLGVSCSTTTLSNGYRTKVVEKNGVELTLTLPEVASEGGPVNLALKLTNRRTLPILIEHYNGVNELNIYVWDDFHHTPAILPLGHTERINQPPPMSYFQLLNSQPLNPGESYEWRLDLAQYYGFYSPHTFYLSTSVGVTQMRFDDPSIPGKYLSLGFDDVSFEIK